MRKAKNICMALKGSDQLCNKCHYIHFLKKWHHSYVVFQIIQVLCFFKDKWLSLEINLWVQQVCVEHDLTHFVLRQLKAELIEFIIYIFINIKNNYFNQNLMLWDCVIFQFGKLEINIWKTATNYPEYNIVVHYL